MPWAIDAAFPFVGRLVGLRAQMNPAMHDQMARSADPITWKVLVPNFHRATVQRNRLLAPHTIGRANTMPVGINVHNVDATSLEMAPHGSKMADYVLILRDKRKGFEHKNRTIKWRNIQAKIDDIPLDEIELDVCHCRTLLRGIKHPA